MWSLAFEAASVSWRNATLRALVSRHSPSGSSPVGDPVGPFCCFITNNPGFNPLESRQSRPLISLAVFFEQSLRYLLFVLSFYFLVNLRISLRRNLASRHLMPCSHD